MSFVSNLLPPISIKTIVTCLIWYLISSVTSQLTKVILIQFTYPLFLSQCQFLIGAGLALAFISLVKRFPQTANHFPVGSVPLDSEAPIFSISVLLKVLPLGLFQSVGRYFSLSAVAMISLATVSSIKALSPLLIVAGYRFVYHVKFPYVTYLSLTPLLMGVVLIITSDSLQNPNSKTSLLTNENNELDPRQVKGLVFCLISTVIFAAQNIYGKQLITWDSDHSKNPASLVLNTELSRPVTPRLGGGGFSPPLSNTPEQNSVTLALKNLVRQRNSLKLPYSNSDLRLDEKNDDQLLPHHFAYEQYDQTVQHNNTDVHNPFAAIINKFDLNKVAKPDQMTIILYCSIVGFLFSFGGFIMNELAPIFHEFTKEGSRDGKADLLTISGLIMLDSLSYFLQTLLAFHLLGSIPALSYSIASMMKRIVIIAVSILLAIGSTKPEGEKKSRFGEVTQEQVVGLVLIGLGLYCYDRWGSRSLKPSRT
ncbi:member of triose phosphate translocator family [Scheffersomyces xylosifermentans]|uniref:member of triose phosphate translocator family n=1 Tax=Scheffersomyces xylosifermentans TaxID=1304137 RepID=UPI00315D81B0